MQTKLSQKLGQRLALTPQLTQSLKVLAMNTMDLNAYIEECLESNPVLEADERPVDDGRSAQEAETKEVEAQSEWREDGDSRWESMYNPSSSTMDGPDMRDQQWQDEQTVAQSLHEQIGRQPMPDDIRVIAHALIDSLDDDGYLRTEPEQLAADISAECELIEQTLHEVIHQLDPPGIGARNLSECLLLQLDEKAPCDALARQLILHFPDALLEGDAKLAKLAQCDIQALGEARTRLRRLDPFPGHGLRGQENIYIRPEIIFRRTPQGEVQIEVPGYNWQGLRMSEQWQGRSWQGADREFVDHATREAKWLLHALDQRRDTLHKVAVCLAKRQRAFLDYGPLGLKPLTLQDVALDVGLHESTISRVTNGKYAETPLGLIEMRRFFSAGLPTRGGGTISVYRVQLRVKALIESEPKGRPISDQAIADRLCAEGIEIARRTVAKYRENMGIPPTSRRRKLAG
ncbi:MAG: RNA polymerase factor sigma-54 [Mariprofundaceae bacterium]|nr:RNA polymerase factor sigma-54 [Mariprofundaceae bacterium]